MTDEFPTELEKSFDGETDVASDERRGRVARPRREPTAVLNLAMVVYIFINLLFSLPLLIFPVAFFDAIGLSPAVADELGALRWVGAMLLAWAVSGITVLAKPGGRAIFMTTGALQLTFAAFVFLYSWSISEQAWDSWYHLLSITVLVIGSMVMWWARFVSRRVFKGAEA